jgi:hypothetical protein
MTISWLSTETRASLSWNCEHLARALRAPVKHWKELKDKLNVWRALDDLAHAAQRGEFMALDVQFGAIDDEVGRQNVVDANERDLNVLVLRTYMSASRALGQRPAADLGEREAELRRSRVVGHRLVDGGDDPAQSIDMGASQRHRK